MAVTAVDANFSGYALQLGGRRSSRFASSLPYRLKHPVAAWPPMITAPRPKSEAGGVSGENHEWARLPGGAGVSFRKPLCATHGAWPFKWEILSDLSDAYYSINNNPESTSYGFVTFSNVPAGTYTFVILCTDQYYHTRWVEISSSQFIDATTDNGANFVVLQPDGTNVSGVAGSWNNPFTKWDQMYLGGAIQAHTDATYTNHIVLMKGTGELSPVLQVKFGNSEKPRHYIFLEGSSVTINSSTYNWQLDNARDDISVTGPGIFDCHGTCETTQQAGNFTADNTTDICTFTTGITNITTGASWTIAQIGVFTADSTTDICTFTSGVTNIVTGAAYTLSNSGGALPAGLTAGTWYAINVTATTCRWATSLANALANIYVDITTNGTGTQSATAIDTGQFPAPLAPSTTYYAIRVTDTTFKLAATYADALAGTAINLTSNGTGTLTARDFTIPSASATGRASVFSLQKVMNRATFAGMTVQNYTGTNSDDNPGPFTGIRDQASKHINYYAITFNAITAESANGSLIKLMSAGRECVIDGMFCTNVTSFQAITGVKHNGVDITIRRVVAWSNCEFGTVGTAGAITFAGGSLRQEISFCELGSSNGIGIDWYAGAANTYAVQDFAVFRNTCRATSSARQTYGQTNNPRSQPPPRILIARNIFQSRRPSVRASAIRIPFPGARADIFDNKIGVAGLVDSTLTPLIDWDGKYGAKRVYYA